MSNANTTAAKSTSTSTAPKNPPTQMAFVKAWMERSLQNGTSNDVMKDLKALGYTVNSVSTLTQRASNYRKQGIALPKMPVKGREKSDVTAAQALVAELTARYAPKTEAGDSVAPTNGGE